VVTARLHLEQPAKPLKRFFARKSQRRKAVRYSLLALNVVVLIAVGYFVFLSRLDSSGSKATVFSSLNKTNIASDPLDQLSSADIAVNVARMTNLPEATAVTNQADSENAELAISQASDSLVSKPQVVASSFKSNKDIQVYMVRKGDTVATVAAKFHVTSDSIIWSNGLTGNELTPGTQLYIPPVNGVVYVVHSGDTADSLAAKFHTTKAKIIAYNDAEINGLHPGERIIIPDGKESAASPAAGGSSSGGAFGAAAWGSSPIYGYNGYDYGYCTWYVASQLPVPANWGNASSWAYYAGQSGWSVSSVPHVGAIAQTPYAAGGEGHVAMVTAVSPDGQSVKITDMNGVAGWGRVGTAWQPTSKYPNYISR
jgi:surface antigen